MAKQSVFEDGVEEIEEELEDGQKPREDPKAIEKLQQLTEQKVRAELSAEILRDEDMSKVLRLKQGKKKFKIVELDEEEDLDESKISQKPLDEMTDEEKSDALIKQVEKAFDKRLKKIVEPLSQQVNSIIEQFQKQQYSAGAKEIEEFKESHPDFELYRDSMNELLQRHPTLGIADLYVLAKGRMGGFIDKSRISGLTETERPSYPAARESKRKYAPTMDGLRKAIEDSLRRQQQAAPFDEDM